MPLNKFIPLSPDLNITKDSDMGMAQFGHLNTIVDYLNTYVAADSLQLDGTGPLSVTLRAVTDAAGNLSPLKISTTSVQVVSPLRITTDDASDFYLDCEDGSTNNRFSIKRNTASQQVNLDFASNPSGSTTTVGAIRTFRDGVNLSEVMTFREDGNVGIGTNAPTATTHIKGSGSTSATTSLLVQNSASVSSLQVTDNGNLIIGTTASNLGSIFIPRDASFGLRNFLFNQDGNAIMYTRSNDQVGFRMSTFFDSFISVNGAYATRLSLTVSLNAPNSTDSLIRMVGNTFSSQTNGTCVGINLEPIFDTDSGSATAKFIGFFYNPNLADLQSAKHYGIQTTSGGAYINTATPNASAALQADSTTQGFLPPRMTTTQKNLITTPAIGLQIFDTDLNRPCFYNGAWITL